MLLFVDALTVDAFGPAKRAYVSIFLRQFVDPTSISHFSDSYLSNDVCYVSNM